MDRASGIKARGLLVRGEAVLAGSGLALAALLVCAITASGWWVARMHSQTMERVRAEHVQTTGELLSRTAEAMIEADELTALRRIVIEAGRVNDLSVCRVVLPDGGVLADLKPANINVRTLDPQWEGSLSPEHARPGVSRYELALGDRGKAYLDIAPARTSTHAAMWEHLTGLGAIGVAAMVVLMMIYRNLRRRIRPLGAIREGLLAFAHGERASGALLMGGELNDEARAWNELVMENVRLRDELAGELARESITSSSEHDGDLASACDAMWQGLVLVDANLNVVYANGAAAVFLDTDRKQLVGGTIADAVASEGVLDVIRAVVSGRIRHRESVEADRGGSDKGVAGVLRYGVRPVRQEDTAEAMIVIEDITQQRVADEARRAFVAQVTHELRNPLTNIRLYVEAAIDEGERDEALLAKSLNVINEETRRLERIVGDMLSVAEIEAGTLELNVDDVRLDALFEVVESSFQTQAQEKEITLEFDMPPKLPVLRGDRDKIVMAVHNLVGNALKYTPAGGHVRVGVEEDQGGVRVTVSDNGIGIDESEQARVFERFYRADDRRVAGITGSGLGLAIAREVVRRHGGDIALESVRDRGSTFTMTLPMLAKAA